MSNAPTPTHIVGYTSVDGAGYLRKTDSAWSDPIQFTHAEARATARSAQAACELTGNYWSYTYWIKPIRGSQREFV